MMSGARAWRGDTLSRASCRSHGRQWAVFVSARGHLHDRLRAVCRGHLQHPDLGLYVPHWPYESLTGGNSAADGTRAQFHLTGPHPLIWDQFRPVAFIHDHPTQHPSREGHGTARFVLRQTVPLRRPPSCVSLIRLTVRVTTSAGWQQRWQQPTCTTLHADALS